ncbi:MAG: hypothetical protein HY741_22825 [Chloroflexi bacterium]|nr:hypothetical protein [Chloroflexota bacterium]
MARLFNRSLDKLPVVPEVWLVIPRRMRIWLTDQDPPYRPYGIMVLDTETGAVRAMDLRPAEPTAQDLFQVLGKAMREPGLGAGKPARPESIALSDAALAEGLAPLLKQANLQMEILVGEMPPEVEEIFTAFENFGQEDKPDLPGLMETPGVSVAQVGEFFSAAAAFYRAAPWVRLNNYQVIALKHPREHDYRYTIVMGQGGVEYGLATLPSWAETVYFFTSGTAAADKFARGIYHSLFFDEITLLPFSDVEAWEEHHWDIAAPKAFPIVLVVEHGKTAQRPSALDLEWYIGALRAIPLLVRDYFKPDGKGDYLPLETTLELPLGDGTMRMEVKYPAGEMPRGEMAVVEEWDEDEAEEADEEPVSFDRRQLDGMWADLHKSMGASPVAQDADLERAQSLMYHAFETDNPAKRIALAHEALDLSQDCADAWVMLAEEEADTVQRALEFYTQGVAAGERALGDEFQSLVGHFWGVLETRPYMRAKEGVARTLWQLNRQDEALAQYREMLELNPSDNQGVRDVMVDLLLQREKYAELDTLLEKYKEDWSVVWRYTTALNEFRKHGASVKANKALADALEENSHVPAYLTGEIRVPKQIPDRIEWGGESEAQYYAGQHLNYWRRQPGAVDWLREQMQKPRRSTRKPRADETRSGMPKRKGGRIK